MTPTRKLSRRSFIARVVGGAALGLGSFGAAKAVAGQATDSDSGPGADPVGRGRGSAGRSGVTDRDPSDPSGNGRGLVINPQATTGSSPGAGAQTDTTNNGASGTGGPGATANPVAASGGRRPCSDADASPGDPSRQGRRC